MCITAFPPGHTHRHELVNKSVTQADEPYAPRGGAAQVYSVPVLDGISTTEKVLGMEQGAGVSTSVHVYSTSVCVEYESL